MKRILHFRSKTLPPLGEAGWGYMRHNYYEVASQVMLAGLMLLNSVLFYLSAVRCNGFCVNFRRGKRGFEDGFGDGRGVFAAVTGIFDNDGNGNRRLFIRREANEPRMGQGMIGVFCRAGFSGDSHLRQINGFAGAISHHAAQTCAHQSDIMGIYI